MRGAGWQIKQAKRVTGRQLTEGNRQDVAATMARERYIDLKKLSRWAMDQDVKEGMEAKAEQAGNLVHDRNDREAFRLVGS